MARAKLNSEFIATEAGDITVFNYDGETREYLSSSTEYLAAGVGIPANSCIDVPGERKEGFVICRTADFTAWEHLPDHRGETVYSTKTGEAMTVSLPGAFPGDTTMQAPATPYDKWNGSDWVTDTTAQHAAAVAEAGRQRKQLIDTAMQTISVVQLKLQAGRALTDGEKMKLDATLDYIDAVEATDITTAPVNINWPVAPEV